jgi:hypothetical protein
MNTLSTLSDDITERAAVSIDFKLVCLWTALGLVLTALVFTLGFGAEIGQVLATVAG